MGASARPGVLVMLAGLAVLAGLAFGAVLAHGAPQSGALRHDALRHDAPRPTAGRSIVPAVPVVHARVATALDPREAARDARRAALGARLAAIDATGFADRELDDVEERLLVFDAAGALSPIHRDTLATYVDTLRAGSVTVLAEACAPADDAGGARLQRAVERAFESVGAPAWVVRAQHAPCSLPGGVVLRPAR